MYDWKKDSRPWFPTSHWSQNYVLKSTAPCRKFFFVFATQHVMIASTTMCEKKEVFWQNQFIDAISNTRRSCANTRHFDNLYIQQRLRTWGNSPELLKSLRDIYAYVNVQIVVHTTEEYGVYAMFSEGDAEVYTHNEKERCSGKRLTRTSWTGKGFYQKLKMLSALLWRKIRDTSYRETQQLTHWTLLTITTRGTSE